jgi:hypothetical protein
MSMLSLPMRGTAPEYTARAVSTSLHTLGASRRRIGTLKIVGTHFCATFDCASEGKLYRQSAS